MTTVSWTRLPTALWDRSILSYLDLSELLHLRRVGKAFTACVYRAIHDQRKKTTFACYAEIVQQMEKGGIPRGGVDQLAARYLSHMPALTGLSLLGGGFAALDTVLKHSQANLVYADLRGMIWGSTGMFVCASGIASLGGKFPALRSFQITLKLALTVLGPEHFTDFRNLTELFLEYEENVPSVAQWKNSELEELAQALPKLQKLELRGFSEITYGGIQAFLPKFKTLTQFILDTDVGDVNWMLLKQNFPSITFSRPADLPQAPR